MTEATISKGDFLLFTRFPVFPRIIMGVLLVIVGILIQIFLPINGIFPYERKELTPISFIVGFMLIVIALLIIYPKRLVISEEPKLAVEKSFWKDTTMKYLSDLFNYLNNREKKKKSIAAIFDLKKLKGRLIFVSCILGSLLLYLVILFLCEKLFVSTAFFLFDIYLLLIPLWFIIRIEYWEPEILRKILFYYQFTNQEELNEYEFYATPAVELQRTIATKSNEEIMLPINVRFMIEFDNQPTTFDSLAIQIILNEKMGNKFPSFVCFLRVRKPSDWAPLKKEIAYADRIVKIQHMHEEADLHLFVLSKSPKVDFPYHTSPKEASKIFIRAYKMMRDFA